MSDDNQIKNSSTGSEVPFTDVELQMLVALANKSGFEAGITLNVRGCLVTGTLISWEKYQTLYSTNMAGALRVSGYEEVADSIETSNQELREAMRQQNPSEYFYIHLENTRFFVGDQAIPSNQGTLWRGKLSSVDGFVIGTITPG